MKPTVLIAATTRWHPTARFAMALARAGFTVHTVCPSGHPLSKTNTRTPLYTYRGLAPVRSFKRAIEAAKPDLIVPADDRSSEHLHELYYREQRLRPEGSWISALIERSLGAPESFPVVSARTSFIDLAKEEDVVVPETQVIANSAELKTWLDRVGLPTVLKSDGSSGGEGVRVVDSREKAEQALRELQAPPLLARALKRAVIDRNATLILPCLRRQRSAVNAQTFVHGREATGLVACWRGTVLAGVYFEVLKKLRSSGPASVVRVTENEAMASAARKMVRRLGLSGMVGFDFMLEEETGSAYLIEINPRATQVGHLTLGPGRDLPAALYAAVSGKGVDEAPKVTENDTIALFPQEWTRDPASAFLRSGYHDVPLEEPELVRACLQTRQKRRAWYAQQSWVQVLSGDRVPHP